MVTTVEKRVKFGTAGSLSGVRGLYPSFSTKEGCMRQSVKVVMVISMLCFLAGAGNAQVIADFEDGGTGGFGVAWGGGMALTNAADPAGLSTGVLQVALNAAGGLGAMSKGGIDATGAKLGTYFVYLPAGAPDSLLLKVFAQDQSGWTWVDFKMYAKDIPKDVWTTIHFNFETAHIGNAGFDIAEGPLNRFGIEFSNAYLHGADAAWTGNVFVDNVSLVGVAPEVVADFEDGELGGFGVAWGGGLTLTNIADPTGLSANVMNVNINSTLGLGAISRANTDADGFYTGTFYIYLPTGVPNDLLIKVFAQDQSGWTWVDQKYNAVNIPKDTWYPIHLDFIAAHAGNAAFGVGEGALNRFGLEFAGATWTGDLYVDNVSLFGIEVGEKWIKAAFENQLAGTMGFANNNWGPCLKNVGWLADPTAESAGVLNTDWDFSSGGEIKGSFQNPSVSIFDTQTSTYATKLTFDIWLPADIPLGGTVSIFAQDHTSWNFTEEGAALDDVVLKRGQWNTVEYNVDLHTGAGGIDPTLTLTVGCQILYGSAQAWTGSVYWDNFTLWGIAEPMGNVLSPQIAATIEQTTGVFPNYSYVHIAWIDNTIGTETYNVYMSQSPINNIADAGVIRLTNDVPHGTEYWNHRPFSADGSDATYYYAVTAKKSDGTELPLTDICKAGPITLPTSLTAKAVYDLNFSGKFVLDGLDNEFAEYAAYKLGPEGANGDESAGWTPESTDLSWHTTFVIDDQYLYISADVNDDDLNSDGTAPIIDGTQPWMGDALEFYIGYYNAYTLADYHDYQDVDKPGTGDWRIAYTAWGTTGTATSNDTDFPGVETTVFEKFTGDGYIIEARIALDSLALGGHLSVETGIKMPMQITANDMDPSNNDETRTLQATWGGTSNHESWLRPGAWGFLEVILPGTFVAEGSKIPARFSLSDAYPNPFNPVTTLRFDVAGKSHVRIVVFDMLGKEVRTLVNETRNAGSYTASWDGTDNAGRTVSSGIYFCKMITPDYSRTVKMTLIK